MSDEATQVNETQVEGRTRTALEQLMEAAAPIVEDGGSEAQHERFCEAFTEAAFVLYDTRPTPESNPR